MLRKGHWTADYDHVPHHAHGAPFSSATTKLGEGAFGDVFKASHGP